MKITVLLAVVLALSACHRSGPPPGDPPAKSAWRAAASALQEEIYPASYACDGRRDTRWSSPASDPQWIEFDFGRPATVCGVTILWETAYSSEYRIEVSLDRRSWSVAYVEERGDGRTDYVQFEPVAARYLRVVGVKRPTGWGHSIWEIDVHGPAEQVTQSVSNEAGRATVTFDLRRPLEIGGIRIDWGEAFPREADLLCSTDGAVWTKAGELRDGTGGFDILMTPRTTARYLRAVMDRPADVRGFRLRGPDEEVTPLGLYQLAAEKARPGLYPDSLRKRQVFWTVVGEPDHTHESLLDEYGGFEARRGACSVTPYLLAGGKLLSATDAAVTQALDSGHLPLPSVTWRTDALALTVEAVAEGSAVHVRYRVANVSDARQNGRLVLVIRPVQINPPWQFGGLSSATSMALEGSTVLVNGTDPYLFSAAPDGFGARAFDRGDVIEDIVRGRLPAARRLDGAGDLISGAAAYDFDLEPGASRDVELAVPAPNAGHPPPAGLEAGGRFDDRLARQRAAWSALVDRVVFDLPDRALVNTIRSHLGYVLVNRDGQAIQPGTRQYERSWIRDGALTSVSLLRFGLTNTVRDYIDWYAHFVQPDGMVPPSFRADDALDCGPGSGLEYDGQGLFNYMVMEYYRFTGDRAFLAARFDEMHRSLQFLARIRERTLAPGYMATNPPAERFAGILPKSYSHEGYDPPMHSYWDDFWALKGWKDGAEAARILGRPDVAAWADEEGAKLRAAVKESIRVTMAARKIAYVPGCAEKGDFDPSASAVAVEPCGERDLVPDEAWSVTLDRYARDLAARGEPGWSAGFCPYEARIIPVFAALGRRDEAVGLLRYLMDCRRPADWNHWGEVVYGDPRMGSYIGDMPHTWAGSGIVNAARDLLVMEEGDRLILFKGAPESWFRDGTGVTLGNLPTWFGALDLRARVEGNRLAVELGGHAAPPGGFELWWPSRAPRSVVVDGQPSLEFDSKACRLPAGARTLAAEW